MSALAFYNCAFGADFGAEAAVHAVFFMARYIAKNIVAAKLANECTVQLAYAIGVAEPVGLYVYTHETGVVDDTKLVAAVKKIFPLTPKGIIDHLKLRRPIFRQTASYGHFGRNEEGMYATSQLSQTTLRSVLGQQELDDLLSQRDKINKNLQEILDQHTEPWGIKVSSVEVKNVDLAQEMQRAIAKQAEAERERRAKVIHADGEYQASQKLSDAAAIMDASMPPMTTATPGKASRARWA